MERTLGKHNLAKKDQENEQDREWLEYYTMLGVLCIVKRGLVDPDSTPHHCCRLSHFSSARPHFVTWKS